MQYCNQLMCVFIVTCYQVLKCLEFQLLACVQVISYVTFVFIYFSMDQGKMFLFIGVIMILVQGSSALAWPLPNTMQY